MKPIFFLVILLHSFTVNLVGQDLKHVMKEMKQRYTDSSSLEIVMELFVFEEENQQQPIYHQLIEVKKENSNFWYKLDNIEMLMNNQCIVMLDKQSRIINYTPREPSAEKEFYAEMKIDLDSVFKLYDEPQFLGEDGGISHYLIKEKRGPIEDIHFYISTQPYLLKKIRYKYRTGHAVTIDFVVFDNDPAFLPETFAEKRYVQKVEKEIRPSKYYKEYKLYQNTEYR